MGVAGHLQALLQHHAGERAAQQADAAEEGSALRQHVLGLGGCRTDHTLNTYGHTPGMHVLLAYVTVSLCKNALHLHVLLALKCSTSSPLPTSAQVHSHVPAPPPNTQTVGDIHHFAWRPTDHLLAHYDHENYTR